MLRQTLLSGGLALLICIAAAADETVLEVGPQGLVTIVLPDGVRAEMYPVIEGLKWAYSDCRSGQTTGAALDLAADGLTVAIPVRGPEPGTLNVLGRVQVDPADDRTVRFSYQFTAAQAVKLNCAKLTFRLPIDPYRGQSVATVEGPAMKMDQLPLDPLSGGHLLNASARGAAIAEDQPHGLRVELDAPRWCIMDDLRRWTGAHEYSLQLCALVSAEGTTLAAGQPVSVSGLLRFGSKVSIRAAEPKQSVAVSFAAAQADLTNPWFPRVVDAVRTTLLSVDLGQLGQPEYMHPEPQGDPVTDPATGEIKATARLYANAKRETWIEVVRTLKSAPGRLEIGDNFTARGSVQSYGVMANIAVTAAVTDAGDYTVALIDSGRVVPFSPDGGDARLTWETDSGVRLKTADGAATVTFTGDSPRRWNVSASSRGLTITERVLEPLGRGLNDGDNLWHTLTIEWKK